MTPGPGDAALTPLARPLGDGVYLIDTLYVRPELAASHLVVADGRAAFVDTGPGPAAPRLLGALDELGIPRENVDYLFLTQVHLDHAGGAGRLLQACPSARLVAHPRGARHMIDPSKLLAGVAEVYSEKDMARNFSGVLPAPAERVIEAPDGFSQYLLSEAMNTQISNMVNEAYICQFTLDLSSTTTKGSCIAHRYFLMQGR